jgi:hypothetical protein
MLKDKSYKKCNSLLSEFINAVDIDDSNDELKKKRKSHPGTSPP